MSFFFLAAFQLASLVDTVVTIVSISDCRLQKSVIKYSAAMAEEEDVTSIAVCDFFAKCFISLLDPPESLSELSDGVVMFHALSEM